MPVKEAKDVSSCCIRVEVTHGTRDSHACLTPLDPLELRTRSWSFSESFSHVLRLLDSPDLAGQTVGYFPFYPREPPQALSVGAHVAVNRSDGWLSFGRQSTYFELISHVFLGEPKPNMTEELLEGVRSEVKEAWFGFSESELHLEMNHVVSQTTTIRVKTWPVIEFHWSQDSPALALQSIRNEHPL